MDNFKGYLDFIKSFGAAFALVMGAIIWVGKPYADEYIKDTTKAEIQVLKDDNKELKEIVQKQGKSLENVANYLYLNMDDKDKKRLAQLKSGENPLLDN